MKLLFILDAVDYPTAPNPRLALNAAAVLAGQGHLVHFLLLWDGASPLPAPPKGCGRFVLEFADERRMNEALEHGDAEGSPTALRLARLAARPDAALAAVRMLALHRPRRRAACRKRIAQLDAAWHYDAAIAVAAPYHAALALAGAAIGGKKAAWLMDPYTQNRSYPATPRMLAEETALYRAMDAVFVTGLMAPDYAPGGPFAEFAAKVHTLEFPALLPPPGPEAVPESPSRAGEGSGAMPEGGTNAPAKNGGAAPEDGAKVPAGNSGAPGGSFGPAQEKAVPGPAPKEAPARIRCVFVGTLYPGLRSPKAALALFTALNDPAVSLEFYGGGWERFGPESPEGIARQRAEQTLGSRFSANGPVPPETARQLMAGADILLSLGNTAANQLPSKVFEYCGAGLPVLHLAQCAGDPALPYFAIYPLACVVGPDEAEAPGTLPRLQQFLHAAAGKRLPFAEARRLFWGNTPEAVAQRLLQLLG